MAGVVHDAAEVMLLSYMLGATAPSNLVLRLYQNNYTPVQGSIASSYSESSFGGYSVYTLATGSWSISEISNKAVATYSAQTFSCSGGSQSVYGYYVTGSGGTAIFGEKFAASYTMTTGINLTINPSVSLDSA